MRALRGSVIVGAVVIGALLVGPVAWAGTQPGGATTAPVASGLPWSGVTTPPEATPPETPAPETDAPPTSVPATSSPPPTGSPPPAGTAQPPGPTAPPSSTPPRGGVTGTAVADCSTQQVVFTVVNETGTAITAGVAVPGAPPFRTVSVPAGEQQVLRQAPGAGPFQYVLAQLNPTRTLDTVDGFFPCPQRQDQSIPAASGQPTTVPHVCAVALFLTGAGPLHGEVTVTGDTGFRYTSDAGYTGPDQFDYACLTSEGVFGTVFVQVHAAATAEPSQPRQPTQSVQPVQPVQVTEAPPSAGALASTGSDTSRVARAGAALVLAGGLLLGGLALTRRRT